MNKIWKFDDIVDLDYFCRLDRLEAQSSEMDLHQRDRRIFLEAAKHGELHTSSHRQCLRLWLLERRRLAEDGQQLPGPGSYLESLLRTGTFLLTLLGGMLGIGAGLSYFAYTGRTPLNVFSFFAIFILPQLLLILLVLLRPIFLRITAGTFSPLLKTLSALLKKALASRLRSETKAMPADGRRALASFFPDNKGGLLKWPLFVATQTFAVAFNIGLASVTLFKIATSDLAFGWQTTLDIGARSLYSLVDILALPWSWILTGDFSHPTLAQIEGSRIILKEGMYHLATTDLTSWWPFLLFCLFFYGLLPRLILLLAGFVFNTRRIKRYLQQRRFYKISRRMLTPLVSTQAEPEEHQRSSRTSAAKASETPAKKEPAAALEALVLIPVDLFDTSTIASLKEHLLPQGYILSDTKVVFRSYEEDRQLLEELADAERAVVVVFEAWMAPIREQLLFLEQLTVRLRQKACLAICLLGRPSPERPLTSPRPDEYRLWRRKINECCTGISFLTTPAPAVEEEP